MAASLNKAHIIGHLGADPDMKYTQSGTAVCNLSVATTEKWKGKDGKSQEKTQWHRVVVFGRTAEACAKYLAKGRAVYVDGRIETRDWEDKSGVKRYTTEIIANDVQFLGGGRNDSDRSNDEPAPPSDRSGQASSSAYGSDDNLPFASANVADEPSPIPAAFRRWGG